MSENSKLSKIDFIQLPQNVLFDSVSEGIILVDARGEILSLNKSAQELFGYPREELLGQTIELLVPEDLRHLHTRHRSAFHHTPSQRQMGVGRDLVARRKDGSTFPVEISLSPIQSPGGLVVFCFVIDITRRKQAEEALRREKEKIQQYLDIAGVMLLVIAADETLSMLNKRGSQVLGYPEAELIGKNWFDTFVPPSRREEARQQFHRIIDNQTILEEYFENNIVNREGEERIIAWHNTLLKDESGRITGILRSGEDITERRRTEMQAKLQQQQLAQADKMATLGILVSGVAHEINNPTSFIMLNGKIFSRVWKDIAPILQKHYTENGEFTLAGMPFSRAYDKIGKLIEGVSEGAVRIEKIVRSLKDFARHDTGILNEDIDINQVVESAIVIVHNLIKKTTDHFIVNYGKKIPPVRGNFQQLEQVVINLLTNACQALSERDQALEISTAYFPEKQQVLITVRDEGSGIAPENMAHIFDPFFTTKQSSGGTGLGLSISYNIVNEHGGTLNFESERGKGTIFRVTLPVKKAPGK